MECRDTILEENKSYWTGRASGYSEVNKLELATEQRQKWKDCLRAELTRAFPDRPLTSLSVLNAAGEPIAALQGLSPIPQKQVSRSSGFRQAGSMVLFDGFRDGSQIYVYDMQGKIVNKQKLAVTNGSMPIDQLVPSAGIYTVKVKDGSNIQTIRIRK